MKYLLLILVLIVAPLGAEDLNLEDFSALVRQLHDSMAESTDYQTNQVAADLALRLAGVTHVKAGERMYVVDLRWIDDVGEAMAGELSVARRKLLFVNLVDTLSGLVSEFSAAYAEHAASRQEMNEALDRAMNRTSAVRFSDDAVFDSSLEWCGAGGFVIDQPGEALSLVSAQPAGGAGFAGGSGPAVSGRAGGTGGASSGGSSGYSGSNIPAAGSSVSGGSSPVVSTGHTYSSNSSVPVTSLPSQTRVTVQSPPAAAVTRPAATVQRPVEPPRAKPALPPPPPKMPAPFRPPPPPPVKVPGAANAMFWLMMCVAVIGFVVIMFLIIRNLRKKIVQEQTRVELVEKLLPPERMRSETVYDKALLAAGQGNFAEAIRLLTIGSLLLLEARRVISYQDSLTNGEYLRELLVEQQLHSMFATPLALFDRLIYGFQSPNQKDFEVFKAFYLDLERLKK